MRDTTTHRRRVIIWEWVDARGRHGALSGAGLQDAQLAKIDERLDRLRELGPLDRQKTQGYIFPFKGELKKMKIRGTVAVRPIVVLGPFDTEWEVTLLLVAREENNRLLPSMQAVASSGRDRLSEVLDEPHRRRQRYE